MARIVVVLVAGCVALTGCGAGTPAMSSEGWRRQESLRDAVPVPEGYLPVAGSRYRQGGEGCSWGPGCLPTARVVRRYERISGFTTCAALGQLLATWNDHLERHGSTTGCRFRGRVGPDELSISLRLEGEGASTMSVVVQEADGG